MANIICPTHGQFSQMIGVHLHGSGCPDCNKRGPKKISQKEFVKKAQIIHGIGVYDYSQAIYINSRAPLLISCSAHGKFIQNAENHLNGLGCSLCEYIKRFKNKACAVHGDKYDYSQVKHVSAHDKITILCHTHGSFEQTPASHLNGKGCHHCLDAKRRQEFIDQARAVHGDKYDYSQVVYVYSTQKLAILCPLHGEFWQAPVRHIIAGAGCPLCIIKRVPATQAIKPQQAATKFIDQARAVHGDKYDYSQVVYERMKNKITIICPQHGPFEQTPSNHLAARNGCRKCATAEVMATCQREFTNKARAIHGDKYDYSQVVYKGSMDNVTIICPEHGPFEQEIRTHLSNKGCATCGQSRRTKGQQDFINQARATHGDVYDYSQAVYTTRRNKVTIICPQHGPFEQNPTPHIRGGRCPRCAYANNGQWAVAAKWASVQAGRMAILYVVHMADEVESFFKVGITFFALSRRFRYTLHYKVSPIIIFGSTDAIAVHELESTIKKRFKKLRYLPKERFDGHTECYTNVNPIIEFLSLQKAIRQIGIEEMGALPIV